MMSRLCQICTSPEDEHDGVNIRHAFVARGQRVDTSQFDSKQRDRRITGDDANTRRLSAHSVSQTPFDPVLRQALVDAGVITPEQLEQARLKIEMMTANVVGNRGHNE